MKRVAFYTLGCKLNAAETGSLQRNFEEEAFEVVPFGTPADVAVINTCSVTEEADRKCRQVIRRAIRANEKTFVVVTGCYAQLQPEEVAAIPGVDAVLGAQEKFQLFDLLDSFEKTERTQVEVSCIDEAKAFGPAYTSGDRTRAFLKVQDGCDYTCSFCTIPLARGKSRSQTVSKTLDHARSLIDEGFQEIVLSGVNIGLFGQEHRESLLDLVQGLDTLDGIARYRISSIEPNLLSDALIEFVASSTKFQPHFHMPLQSGNDEVLGKMRRRYRRDVYVHRVNRILDLMPDACIGADVIVGFPAETEAHFLDSVAFIQDLPLAYLHVFTYSERPNTTAVDQLNLIADSPIPKQERSHRNRQLRLLSEKKRRAFYERHLGQTRPVLWEAQEKKGRMQGFTDNYIRIETPYDAEMVNTVSDVVLEAIAPEGHVMAGDPTFISLI